MEIWVQIAQCHAAAYKENNTRYTSWNSASSSVTALYPRIGLDSRSAVGHLPLFVWVTAFTGQGK